MFYDATVGAGAEGNTHTCTSRNAQPFKTVVPKFYRKLFWSVKSINDKLLVGIIFINVSLVS